MLKPSKKSSASSVLPRKVREISPSETIPTLTPQLEIVLMRLVLATGANFVLLMLMAIALFGVAFKPVPDLVVTGDSTPLKTRPLAPSDVPETERVIRFLETRFPILYTWVGVRPNPDDPTGTTFVKDEPMQAGSFKIPTAVWNEQFILAEPIRVSTLMAIGKLIDKTNGVIWQTPVANPALGTSYRFIFRGRPNFPVEVEPGRWKVVVNADVVRVSPTVGLEPNKEKIEAFNFEVYVRRAGRSLPMGFDDKKLKDIVAYGKSSGFEIDAMIPFNPQKVVVPRPQ
jgi:hypothetical protein